MEPTHAKAPPPGPPEDPPEAEAEPGLPQRLFDEARAAHPHLEPHVECLAEIISHTVAQTYEEARAHTVGRLQEHLLALFESVSEAPDAKAVKMMKADPVAAHKAVVVGVRAAVLVILAQANVIDAVGDEELEDSSFVGATKGSA